jgi:ferredoxin-type protein NapH
MNSPEASPLAAPNKGWRYSTLRHFLLAAAFLLLLVNPLLNYSWGIAFIQGWYQSLGIGELRLISPLEGLESLLISKQVYVPALIGMAIPLLIAVLLGRVFCSWVCPISFLAETLAGIRRRIQKKAMLRDRLILAKRLLWFALISELLLSLILGAPLFVFLSPPGLVGRELMMAVFFQRLAWEGVLVIAVLALELVTRRFYCRYFCPLGGLLALLGMARRLVVHRRTDCTHCGRCDRACPMGLAPSLGESLSPYCWNCGACIDSCDHAALRFIWRGGLRGNEATLEIAPLALDVREDEGAKRAQDC